MVKIEKTLLNQFLLYLRVTLPVVLHILNFSPVDYFRKQGKFLDLQTDLSSVLFSVLLNFVLGSRYYLLPRAYRPSSFSKVIILNVILQIVFSDVCFRILVIPFFYFLHFICINGHLTKFINNFLFVIHVFDNMFQTRKGARWLKTEKGFEWLTKAIPASFIFLILLRQGTLVNFKYFICLFSSFASIVGSSILDIFKFHEAVTQFKVRFQKWCECSNPRENQKLVGDITDDDECTPSISTHRSRRRRRKQC